MSIAHFWDVLEFHQKFGLTHNDGPKALTVDQYKFRIGFMDEELTEYKDAVEEGDLAKQLDALVDLCYVAMGTAILQGFPFQAAWDRVHIANMMKVHGPTSADGASKIVKPPGWTAPDLSDLVRTENK